ncbi:PsbQ-like domain [Pseudocohnilembus persalinus]|uniref:PsbQ-like domain n=1 Tax=Pseudocohnilembus persalinus TaxID=266149 RepID=A0A0V0QB27_PSEPJ|nr:PsbQ-like domain [Pseudocohnilembus persalinus]|eukprot:KRW99433.1 PsbQ-like domain [Pseudocohnilembus persalinus]
MLNLDKDFFKNKLPNFINVGFFQLDMTYIKQEGIKLIQSYITDLEQGILNKFEKVLNQGNQIKEDIIKNLSKKINSIDEYIEYYNFLKSEDLINSIYFIEELNEETDSYVDVCEKFSIQIQRTVYCQYIESATWVKNINYLKTQAKLGLQKQNNIYQAQVNASKQKLEEELKTIEENMNKLRQYHKIDDAYEAFTLSEQITSKFMDLVHKSSQIIQQEQFFKLPPTDFQIYKDKYQNAKLQIELWEIIHYWKYSRSQWQQKGIGGKQYLNDCIEKMENKIDKIQNTFKRYLDKIRNKNCRFNFISSDQFLQIFSLEKQNPQLILNEILSDCFPGIMKIDIENEKYQVESTYLEKRFVQEQYETDFMVKKIYNSFQEEIMKEVLEDQEYKLTPEGIVDFLDDLEREQKLEYKKYFHKGLNELINDQVYPQMLLREKDEFAKFSENNYFIKMAQEKDYQIKLLSMNNTIEYGWEVIDKRDSAVLNSYLGFNKQFLQVLTAISSMQVSTLLTTKQFKNSYICQHLSRILGKQLKNILIHQDYDIQYSLQLTLETAAAKACFTNYLNDVHFVPITEKIGPNIMDQYRIIILDIPDSFVIINRELEQNNKNDSDKNLFQFNLYKLYSVFAIARNLIFRKQVDQHSRGSPELIIYSSFYNYFQRYLNDIQMLIFEKVWLSYFPQFNTKQVLYSFDSNLTYRQLDENRENLTDIINKEAGEKNGADQIFDPQEKLKFKINEFYQNNLYLNPGDQILNQTQQFVNMVQQNQNILVSGDYKMFKMMLKNASYNVLYLKKIIKKLEYFFIHYLNLESNDIQHIYGNEENSGFLSSFLEQIKIQSNYNNYTSSFQEQSKFEQEQYLSEKIQILNSSSSEQNQNYLLDQCDKEAEEEQLIQQKNNQIFSNDQNISSPKKRQSAFNNIMQKEKHFHYDQVNDWVVLEFFRLKKDNQSLDHQENLMKQFQNRKIQQNQGTINIPQTLQTIIYTQNLANHTPASIFGYQYIYMQQLNEEDSFQHWLDSRLFNKNQFFKLCEGSLKFCYLYLYQNIIKKLEKMCSYLNKPYKKIQVLNSFLQCLEILLNEFRKIKIVNGEYIIRCESQNTQSEQIEGKVIQSAMYANFSKNSLLEQDINIKSVINSQVESIFIFCFVQMVTLQFQNQDQIPKYQKTINEFIIESLEQMKQYKFLINKKNNYQYGGACGLLQLLKNNSEHENLSDIYDLVFNINQQRWELNSDYDLLNLAAFNGFSNNYRDQWFEVPEILRLNPKILQFEEIKQIETSSQIKEYKQNIQNFQSQFKHHELFILNKEII